MSPILATDLTVQLQVVITIFGAGIAAYVGVKVAIAQIQTKQENMTEDIKDIGRRLDRLEEKHFR